MPKTQFNAPWGGKGERLLVQTSEFRGREYLGVRVWYYEGTDLRPSKNGFSVPLNSKADVVNSIEALEQMQEILRTRLAVIKTHELKEEHNAGSTQPK